jgi:hypothetical protein
MLEGHCRDPQSACQLTVATRGVAITSGYQSIADLPAAAFGQSEKIRCRLLFFRH